MRNATDVEIWSSQIARWKEQAAVVAKRMESRRVMYTAGAICEEQFTAELKSLEADRLVYLHVVEEAEARLRDIPRD